METVAHILQECPRYAKERYEIECRLEAPLTNLVDVVENANKAELEAFIKYAREIVGKAARANGATLAWRRGKEQSLIGIGCGWWRTRLEP